MCRSLPQGVDHLPAHVVAAVPCLRHSMRRVQGPERQLVLSLAPASSAKTARIVEINDAKDAQDAQAGEEDARREVSRLLSDLPPSRLDCGGALRR